MAAGSVVAVPFSLYSGARFLMTALPAWTAGRLRDRICVRFSRPLGSISLVHDSSRLEDDARIATLAFEDGSRVLCLGTGQAGSFDLPRGQALPDELPLDAELVAAVPAPLTAPAAAAAPAPAPADGGSISIPFRMINGQVYTLQVPVAATLQQVHDQLQRATGRRHAAFRFIHKAARLDPTRRVCDYDLQRDSTVHVVLANVSLDDPITRDGRCANCPMCHTPGASFDIRPLCRTCGNECVLLKRPEMEPKDGRSTWRQLLHIEVVCCQCDPKAAAALDDPVAMARIKYKPASVGFLCKKHRRPDEEPCPSNHYPGNSALARPLRFCYDARTEDPVEREARLVRALLQMKGYAHGAGVLEFEPTPTPGGVAARGGAGN